MITHNLFKITNSDSINLKLIIYHFVFKGKLLKLAIDYSKNYYYYNKTLVFKESFL